MSTVEPVAVAKTSLADETQLEKETGLPQAFQTAYESIKRRATLHNVIYIIIVTLSLIVFAGEIFVLTKALSHKHEEIPMVLTISLVTMSGVLFLLAFVDRYLAWRHQRHLVKEKETQLLEQCTKEKEAHAEAVLQQHLLQKQKTQ